MRRRSSLNRSLSAICTFICDAGFEVRVGPAEDRELHGRLQGGSAAAAAGGRACASSTALSDKAASTPTAELFGTTLAASGPQPAWPGATRKRIMNKPLIALLAATAATLSLGAYAADTMTHDEADAAKAQAKADYKADKAQAKADYHANKADCERHTEGAVERACKHDAKAQAKVDKADAKLDYKQDKADIKGETK
jgi:cell division septum initiation protein DivIVA